MAAYKRLTHIPKFKVSIMVISMLLAYAQLWAQLKLPALLRDSMVLQRDAPIRLWGWAGSNEKLRIEFKGKNYRTSTGKDRRWQVLLPAMPAGGPFTMTIRGNTTIVLHEILLGDVWICSGQSNMVHQMALHNITYAHEIADANYPMIRHFTIATTADLQKPKDDLPPGYWKSANPIDILQFSAVAYFFAKNIYDKYRVPIGLINASVGGTPIEAWTSADGLHDFPDLQRLIKKNADTSYVNETNRRARAWDRARQIPADAGLNGARPWYDTAYIVKGWHSINIPGYWEDQGVKDLDGVVWYRKEVDLPASMSGKIATVFLGRIIDADVLYINGVQAGTTGYQYPQRRYNLPAGLLRPGRNQFVIRVTNQAGKGGFVPGKPYFVQAGNDTIDLKGYWQYRVGAVFENTGAAPAALSFQNQPTALYNAMIAPVAPFNVKGVLWYQGESNAFNPKPYTRLLPALISDWRKLWQRPLMPFIYVQLPNFMEANYLPSESQWALLREAQLKTLSVPNTAMAVAIDLGEWNDIHPDNKKDVGTRLALAARKLAYAEPDLAGWGPLYSRFQIQGNRIEIEFTGMGSGLISNDNEPLQQFAVAGADKRFRWAQAIIRGNKVVVWNDSITDPQFVRYAWADNPEGANLYNKEGLPASPFRTDDDDDESVDN
jgi:sialate O-acetylesterase